MVMLGSILGCSWKVMHVMSDFAHFSLPKSRSPQSLAKPILLRHDLLDRAHKHVVRGEQKQESVKVGSSPSQAFLTYLAAKADARR
mmetsp:Transcript_124956/g.400298  ORF Transcript_124956/g.400298 Transcript_124956/m.400298 type:complete len:86 (-) Transcript_124956:58-315(-)